jgi:choline trimethylamine-lyase
MSSKKTQCTSIRSSLRDVILVLKRTSDGVEIMYNIKEDNLGLEANERVMTLRKSVLCTPQLCLERAYLMTESYKETEGEPALIRRARALEKILNEMSIYIKDGELIVGRATSKQRGGPLLPEVIWDWSLKEMDTLSTREWDKICPLTEGEKAKMKEFLPYWKGKAIYDKWDALLPNNVRKLLFRTHVPAASPATNMHLCHLSPGYEKVLTQGLKGLKAQVDAEIKKLNIAETGDYARLLFFNSVNITLAAVENLAKRYARLARIMAEKAVTSERKSELEKIAEICEWVPANPARSFYEALQSMWLAYIAVMIEGWGPGISFGRVDQYLYPFYKKDIEEGKLTRGKAAELIALLYIKLNEIVLPSNEEHAKGSAGFAMLSNFTLGGLTKHGRDAVNELSYLFLEVDKSIRLNNEDLVIRVHKNTPDAFLIKACEVARLLKGKLKFISDETTIQQLLSDGKPPEYARDYVVVGCLTPTVPAKSLDSTGDMLNLPLMLELALNNGVSRLTKEQIGPQTGDPRIFCSYNEVWNAYKKQVENLICLIMPARHASKQLYAEYLPTPFQSALFDGCIEKGIDITNGGTAPYRTYPVSASGAPNVGDSLAAIKKVVFEDKKITMEQLIDALDCNFEGKNDILYLLKNVPKFGNDNDYVDDLVNEVLIQVSEEAAKYCGYAGAKTNTSTMTITANIQLGYAVGALPDGRKAGEPISEVNQYPKVEYLHTRGEM